MAPVIYLIDASPPCRAVLMLAKAIGLGLDVKEVKMMQGEHLTPEYLKMNPLHTVPTIDDGGFFLYDSHAITIYLLSKYGKNDSLYPKDIKQRAIIDQRLHFDTGVAFSLLARIGKPMIMRKTKTVPEDLKEGLREAYGFLETFLTGNKWVCGNSLTLADIHLAATISSGVLFEPLTDKYPNVNNWLNNCKKESWYEANLKGLNDYNNMYTSLMNA